MHARLTCRRASWLLLARAALPQLLQYTGRVSACHIFSLSVSIYFTSNGMHKSPVLMPSHAALSGLAGLCTGYSTLYTPA